MLKAHAWQIEPASHTHKSHEILTTVIIAQSQQTTCKATQIHNQIHQSITTMVTVAARVAPGHALSPQGVSVNLATAVGGLTLISAVGSRPLVYLPSLSSAHRL